ncbi:RRP15-like protein [Ctenocephalides felis]|uniref:RRP15-like protein n=1 Tax=Ctenocephalides felis TaxID=7515 RepID=UPI000E6E2FD4|nr:RRP15-like protein [Ctenocephalides felis]
MIGSRFENSDISAKNLHDEDESASEIEENSESEAENLSEDDGNAEKKRSKNEGWADSMAKILKSNKPKGKSTIVLAKAKKICEVIPKATVDYNFEIVNEIKEEKPDIKGLHKIENKDQKKKKKDIIQFRIKPSILDKDRERTLSKIATRGVVQLFNAVRTQQRDISNKLKEAGPLERKQDKVLKNIDKRAFLDVLMGGKRSISQQVDGPVKTEKQIDSKWNVLRDDFMLESKLKDWDKEDDSEENDETI